MEIELLAEDNLGPLADLFRHYPPTADPLVVERLIRKGVLMNGQEQLTRRSQAATISRHHAFALVGQDLILAKARDAAANPRKREIHVLHSDDQDPLQRMLNAIQPSTYVQPHRHLHPPKAETFVLLQGQAGIVIFDDSGEVMPRGLILMDQSHGVVAVDVREGVWHTLVALVPETVLFEVKPGPYHAPRDKDVAPWSPDRDHPSALSYLADLEDRLRIFWKLPQRQWNP